jgi:hypothetical protein
MARRLVFLCLSIGCALLLAACGGSKKTQQSYVGAVYSRGPVAKCLRSHGFTVSTNEHDMNFIAYTATGGGLRAWKPKKHRKLDLILAFGADGADAQQTMKAVKRFALQSAIFRYRARRANAVMLWAYRPSPKNKQLLYNCLNSSVAKTSG